ncbi:MAG TPA: hypothetical protein VIR33_01680 [Thermopolyspora sp.]|jgi:hypothetical protein
MPVEGYTPADLARMKTVQARPKGWTWRTRDQVREYRDKRGRPVKVIRDQLGNYVRLRWTGQDAHVFLPAVRVRLAVGEIR